MGITNERPNSIACSSTPNMQDPVLFEGKPSIQRKTTKSAKTRKIGLEPRADDLSAKTRNWKIGLEPRADDLSAFATSARGKRESQHCLQLPCDQAAASLV